jgi:TRAP-type C4-dicarboxylate transport system substrate-binding protein
MNLGIVIQDKVNTLPPDLQEEVLRYIEKLASANRKIQTVELEQEVSKRLLAKGIISEIPEPMTDEEDAEIELITIEGEPLSKTIIKERR